MAEYRTVASSSPLLIRNEISFIIHWPSKHKIDNMTSICGVIISGEINIFAIQLLQVTIPKRFNDRIQI